MNRRTAITAALAGPAAAAAADTWKDPFAREWRDSFLLHWRVTKDYTLAVLDAMPDSGWESKPNPAQRPFWEQLVHLGRANVAYMTAFNVRKPPEPPKGSVRAEVRSYLSATFDYVTEVIGLIGENELRRKDLQFNSRVKPHSGTDLFMRAYMHTAHHRGQAIVYLRVNGIAPPTWAFEPTAHA